MILKVRGRGKVTWGLSMKKDEKGTQDQAMDISALSSGEEGANRGD